jgi:S1-C subfamily serine protease
MYDTKEGTYTGTGFAVDKDRILTAAHYCQDFIRVSHEGNVFDGYYFVELTYLKDNKFLDKAGIQLLKYDKEKDLCLIKYENHGIPVLPIAEKSPMIGEGVSVVGSPATIFPVRTNGYVVDLNERDGLPYEFFISAPVFNGNSGGPVFYNNKVVGIVVRSMQRYHHISVAVKAEEILRFLKETRK